jgi:hypothetical protein
VAKKWIQKANLKRGAFTKWCESKGFDGVTEECIAMGKKSDDPTTRRRANLASTFRKMARSGK